MLTYADPCAAGAGVPAGRTRRKGARRRVVVRGRRRSYYGEAGRAPTPGGGEGRRVRTWILCDDNGGNDNLVSRFLV